MRETRTIGLLSSVIALVIVLGVSACGGDDDDEDGTGTTTTPSAVGDDLTIDPEEGPAGTAIDWTISNCDPDADKSVSIYPGAPGEDEGGDKAILEGPDTKDDTGQVKVPAGTAPGEYTVIGTCLTVTEKGGGQVQFGVRDAGEVAFSVTE